MKPQFILGPLAIIAAWVTIGLSVYLNPWFRVTGNALSDLGGGTLLLNGHPAPAYPWVYNYGLIITGVIIALFSLSVITSNSRKIGNIGMSFFIISGLFLALIGVYHEGTYPHDFVSIWFFIIASISYLVVGISLLHSSIKFGISLIILIILAWIIYLSVNWQSVAEDEIFGVVVIDIAVLMHLFSMRTEYKIAKHTLGVS